MDRIDEMIEAIIAREGGFVNDPDDPGGATNLGITIHTLRGLGLDLTGDGTVSEADVRAIKRVDAARIYRVEYFERPGIARLPQAVQAAVFDMYVNSGSRAVRLLQDVLVAFGEVLVVDGKIGPITAAAAHRVARAVGADRLNDAYGVERRNFYYRLADRRPTSRKFARRRDGGKGGWILRAEEFIARRWHLTDAQHRARVASWG
ncbi:holin-associated N-acetylmuramidase [Roseobacter sp. HKCCA0434]|uniref:holin-associated N-acetylmuramidase n=1 Tax=Roseobacter sp. HKCCA0434 TaxID=3079297 RepID=UPI002905B9FD|nr:holin-associated N-acetylmuramidase [Roseobacter sp. HKCCA0434]